MPCSFGLLPHPRSETAAPVHWPPRSDRGCPLDTARDRCLWHVGGTTGENHDARIWRQRLPARPTSPAPDNHCIVGKSPKELSSRRVGHQVVNVPGPCRHAAVGHLAVPGSFAVPLTGAYSSVSPAHGWSSEQVREHRFVRLWTPLVYGLGPQVLLLGSAKML
jgi:hypothetical protein